MNVINSSFVQWLLKWGLSKSGPFVASGVSFCLIHIGLQQFVPHDAYVQIENGLNAGALALVSTFYAWLQHRQMQSVKILKAQLDASPQPTPDMDMNSGAVGNNTLMAAASVTGVSIAEGAEKAGVPARKLDLSQQ